MEPHRGTPALQKLLRSRSLDLDDLESKFGSRFLEVFDLLVAMPFLIILHPFIDVFLTVLQHSVH
jgi:hypothetical protein